MTILLAPDKFKGSLTARQVCSAIETGFRKIDPGHTVIHHPMADGGEGTIELLVEFTRSSWHSLNVADPLFREIRSEYAISPDGKTAFLEMSKASGLQLLKPEEKNPLITTSFGTGQLIRDALNKNVGNIILAIGGSATNDAGIGMAAALGCKFFSSSGQLLSPVGENLIHIHSIDSTGIHPGLKELAVTVICDVEINLHGLHGAAHVFAHQKGANADSIQHLDKGLRHFEKIVKDSFGIEVNVPGSGAAGGMGAGAITFLNGTIARGFDFMAALTHLEAAIQKSDLIITGEGKIDQQTLRGKVVQGVARLCAKHGKKCLAFAGICTLTADERKELQLEDIIVLEDNNVSKKEAMLNASSLLTDHAARRLPGWIDDQN